MKLILNLQLFAENTQTTGSTDLSAEMKTFYDMVLIDEASANLVHDQFGQKRPIPANGGKQIEFRKFAPFDKATTPLTEGVTPTGKNLEVSTITSTVNQYGDMVIMSDMLQLTAIDKIIVEATKLCGQQAGASLDTVTRNVLVSGTNVSYCPKISGGTETAVTSRTGLGVDAKLTVDMVQRVVAKLRGANAPTFEDGNYVAIIHPYVAYDLMRDPEWIDAYKYANPDNLYKGEIGKIAGCRFVSTTEAKVWNNSTCPSNAAKDGYHSVFATLFMGRNAYGVTEIEDGGLQTIVKQLGSGGTSDGLNQRSSVGWKATKTAEILIPRYLVRVESCSPKFDTTETN